MLRFASPGGMHGDKPSLPTVHQRRSLFPEEQEEFNPNKEVAQFVEAIKKFIKDQELPDEEERPTLNKLQVLSKMVDHYKSELKSANLKSTEDSLKLNNLQSKLPKLEESRVRLSQKCDSLRDELEGKEAVISKLKSKIKALETMSNKSIDDRGSKEKNNEKPTPAKQAVIPKSVLKEVMQASEKEVEAKLQNLASSNEAIRVVLVRKNKQIRQLDGTIILLNTEMRSLKQKIAELQDAIVAGTTDVEAIKQEAEEREAVVKTPLDPQLDLPDQGTSTPLPLEASSVITQSLTEHDSIADSAMFNFDVANVDASTNTEVEVEEAETQTEEDSASSSRPTSPDIEKITFKIDRKRRNTRKGSIAMVAEAAIRRASMKRFSEDSSRRGSMAKQDIFGMGSAQHKLTSVDIATIEKFEKEGGVNDKSVKQCEDIALLQKYIASMREQSEKSMEKVREFIAKEKTRNEATTRRLINEHEKVLSVHKKELNKVVFSIHRFKETVTEILNGKDITQLVLQSNFKYEQSPLQLRIQSTEMLSSLEFEIFQGLKEKDMKIRDLSGRKRLDDKDLDRRIKEREKTVFSLLDHSNARLRKEKERVTMREQWVNKKIKTELEFEKNQEFEVQAIEKALARFWREHCSDFTKMPTSQVSLVSPPPPETTPRSEVTEEQQHIEDVPNNKSRDSAEETPEHLKPTPFSIGFEAVVPKLYISVSDQRSNLEYLDMAHRAGLLSNLAHKLITNIITRWSELIEQKIAALFAAYLRYRRYNTLQMELMNQDSAEVDLNRAMILHRKIRDNLDLHYKRLHVNVRRLTTYCDNMLEEEDHFFDTIQDPRVSKNLVRPNMLHINHSAMLKKLKDSVPVKQTMHVHFPLVTSETSSTPSPLARLEEIPLLKQVASNRPTGKWRPEQNNIALDTPTQPLLIPKILQLDTNKMTPVRLDKQPTQNPDRDSLRKFASGLPPIPLCSGMKQARISYIPNVCSVYSNKEHKNSIKTEH